MLSRAHRGEKFWQFQSCDSVNRAIRDSRFCAAKGQNFVCSMPSLKFVKEFLRFSVSRPGHREDNNTKNHEEWPQNSQRVTDSD